MLGWLARLLLFCSGLIAGLFISREDAHFQIMQWALAMFLLILVLAIAAFWRSFYPGTTPPDQE